MSVETITPIQQIHALEQRAAAIAALSDPGEARAPLALWRDLQAKHETVLADPEVAAEVLRERDRKARAKLADLAGQSDAAEQMTAIIGAMVDAHAGLGDLPSASERARSRGAAPLIVKVPSGIVPLDRVTDGGVDPGKMLVAIGGAPNAGKTSLAVAIAHYQARHGYAVALHCADEPAHKIMMRIGQLEGLRRADLSGQNGRENYELAWERLAERLAELPHLIVVDQDLDGYTLDQTARRLASDGKGDPHCKGRVLVCDSIQKARATGTDEAKDLRLRANAVLRALQTFGAKHDALVIATSEVSRAAYRGGSPRDSINAMAAFKESGDIEYAMQTGLVLTSVPGDGDLVRVEVPKNKGGGRDGEIIRLRRDHRRCSYEEAPAEEIETTSEAKQRAELEADIEKVVRVVATAGPDGVAGKEALGKLCHRNAPAIRAATDEALNRGRIRNAGTAGRPRYVLGSGTP